jgi:hypothetical protein
MSVWLGRPRQRIQSHLAAFAEKLHRGWRATSSYAVPESRKTVGSLSPAGLLRVSDQRGAEDCPMLGLGRAPMLGSARLQAFHDLIVQTGNGQCSHQLAPPNDNMTLA